MGQMGTDALVTGLAIIGIVIIVSALLSGLVDKSGLPQVAVFIFIGAALGPAGFGVFDMSLESPVLRVVATLSLTLVLFTDAVSLNTKEVRRYAGLAFRMLGPGTDRVRRANSVGGVVAARPRAGIRRNSRRGTRVDRSGFVTRTAATNRHPLRSAPRVANRKWSKRCGAPSDRRCCDGVDPQHDPETGGGLAKMGFGLFILGPGAGIAIGLIAVSALDLLRKRVGIRRDYESLYSLGVAFTAFAAAEAVHGSGFLAAFAAGITIAALDVELCDCFMEYGGVTAEMLLLFTFVIFGSSLIWTGFQGLDTRTVIFAAFAILIRVPVYLISLIGSNMDRRGRMVIAWYGPSGLSSLLLILLPVFAGIPGSDQLFRICRFVVLISIIIHGVSPMLFARLDSQKPSLKKLQSPNLQIADAARARTSQRIASLPVSSRHLQPDGTQSITLEDFGRLQKSGEKVILLDVRTERSRESSEFQAKGSVRMPPENVVAQAREMKLPKDAWLIAYCA